jgi:hypothetical protein
VLFVGAIVSVFAWFRARSHHRLRWRLALGVLAAALVGCASIAKLGALNLWWQLAPTAAAVLAGVAASFGPDVLDKVADANQSADERRLRLRAATLGVSGDRLGDVPAELLGVWRSTIAERVVVAGGRAPYVERDVDEQLREALTAAKSGERLVVLCGPPKSGKSRTMREAALQVFGAWRVVVVRRPVADDEVASQPLGVLCECRDVMSFSADELLIWVDDAHEHLFTG